MFIPEQQLNLLGFTTKKPFYVEYVGLGGAGAKEDPQNSG
jgi:hypothetical protein